MTVIQLTDVKPTTVKCPNTLVSPASPAVVLLLQFHQDSFGVNKKWFVAVIFILDLCGEKSWSTWKDYLFLELFNSLHLVKGIRSGVTTLALFGTLATQ